MFYSFIPGLRSTYKQQAEKHDARPGNQIGHVFLVLPMTLDQSGLMSMVIIGLICFLL